MGCTTTTDPVESPRRPLGRRLSEPPPRGICLACRALRIRCDGRKECVNCVVKGKICCYLPHPRGGPRNGRTRTRPTSVASDLSDQPGMMIEDKEVHNNRNQKGLENGMPAGGAPRAIGTTPVAGGTEWVDQLAGLCGPGAGLRKVDMPMVEIESIFDSIFPPAPTQRRPDSTESSPLQIYGSNEAILEAYYIFIHPYYPILPPPHRHPVSNRPVRDKPTTFEPSGPLALALAAVLVLVPHPNEKNPLRPGYIKSRRDCAHRFAQSAYEAFQQDNLPAQGQLPPNRDPFHPSVPLYLEGVIALAVLSVYEYAQRGNMSKMLQRAREAAEVAMSMNLHEAIDEDQFAEARQRAWWTTYITACQAFTVSSTRPTFNAFDPCFVTPYPKGWRLLIASQQALLEAAMFAKDLDQAVKSGADVSWIPQRVAELDGQISSLLFDCRESLSISRMAPSSYSPEYVATKAMRSFAEIKLHSARVKIHRFYAFQDIPVLPKRRPSESDSGATSSSPDDGFRTFISSQIPDLPIASADSLLPSPRRTHDLQFPFSVHTSSKICLHSTLNVVTLLDDLPYPNPTPIHETYPSPSPFSPRSMPTLVCCAMQATYAMLMFCFKARTFQLHGTHGAHQPDVSSLASFRNELYQALRLVGKCMANYSVAFEALQGMRDEVERAIEREFTI